MGISAYRPSLSAKNFPNADFESGNFDGWIVGGRKDARTEVIPSEPIFEKLGRSRQFRSAGGWKGHPVSPFLDRSNNRYLLKITSDGYIHATTESEVTIRAEKQYTVSLLSQNQNGGEATYVANYNAHDFGTRADPIFSVQEWAIPARIFLITRRKEVLDHLLRIADPAILLRNGFETNGTKYGVRFSRPYQRYLNLHDFCVFPEGGFQSEADQGGKYFNARHEYVRDEVSHTTDAANARMITPSLAAYCVSLHPEVWEEIFPDGDPCKLGATYRQRAERYIRELALNYTDYKDHKFFNFQTKFIWDNYTAFHKDNDRYLAERENWEQARRSIKDDEAMKTFLKTNPKPMPKERRAGINRFVAATSCAGFAAWAADTFGDEASA